MARKKQLTLKKLKKTLEETSGYVTFAAKKLGVTPQTVYNYLKDNPDLQVVVDEAREVQLDIAENSLQMKIREGDLNAITFFLRTMGKRRGYVEKKITEHETPRSLDDLVAKLSVVLGKDPYDESE